LLRRHAMVEPTQSAMAMAEQAFAEVLRQRLSAELGELTDKSLTAAWVDSALAAKGAERTRWMAVEHALNMRVCVLVVRCWMGFGDDCKRELTTYANAKWLPLRRAPFWRAAARADRLMLRTLVADMLGLTPPDLDPARAPKQYARALCEGLLSDPGREKISSVRETLDSLEWFVPPDSSTAKLLQQFRRRFDALPF